MRQPTTLPCVRISNRTVLKYTNLVLVDFAACTGKDEQVQTHDFFLHFPFLSFRLSFVFFLNLNPYLFIYFLVSLFNCLFLSCLIRMPFIPFFPLSYDLCLISVPFFFYFALYILLTTWILLLLLYFFFLSSLLPLLCCFFPYSSFNLLSFLIHTLLLHYFTLSYVFYFFFYLHLYFIYFILSPMFLRLFISVAYYLMCLCVLYLAVSVIAA
jgi:hypothetical protein